MAALLLFCLPLSAEEDLGPPRCIFWEGPDIRPTVKGEDDTISECPCYLTGIVKNVGSAPAHYVYIVATVWDNDSGEQINEVWTQVAGGKLQPGQQEFFRFALDPQDTQAQKYRRRFTLRWKDAECTQQGIDCIIESVSKTYRDDSSVHVRGFVRNIHDETGFSPALQAIVLDIHGKTANIITASMPRVPLGAGERVPFVLTIPAFSPTDTMKLSFVD
jgi:hypothetical protein